MSKTEIWNFHWQREIETTTLLKLFAYTNLHVQPVSKQFEMLQMFPSLDMF